MVEIMALPPGGPMKINPTTTEVLRTDRIVVAPDARTAATRGNEPVAEAERVQLSNLAARLNQLEAQFGASDVDTKKVEAVRSAIAEGRFKVNAESVADGLLSSVAELLGRK
jgi:negative regulator of flagellin synthesis FlgM